MNIMCRFIATMVVLASCMIANAQDFSKVLVNTVWYQDGSNIEQIYPTNTMGQEIKGAFKKKIKLVYNGSSSDVKIKEAILYAYANPSYLQSPTNFSIIPLVVESERRTYMWLSASFSKAKTNEDVIPVAYEKVAENVYKVTPKEKLAPGEYGFVNNTAGMPSIIFGFTIVE